MFIRSLNICLIVLNVSCIWWWHLWFRSNRGIMKWNLATRTWEITLTIIILIIRGGTLVFFLKFIYFLENLTLIFDSFCIILWLCLLWLIWLYERNLVPLLILLVMHTVWWLLLGTWLSCTLDIYTMQWRLLTTIRRKNKDLLINFLRT